MVARLHTSTCVNRAQHLWRELLTKRGLAAKRTMAAYGLSLAQGISPQDQEPPGTVNDAGEIAAALKQPEGADKNYTSRIPPDSSVRERRPDGLVGVYTLNVQFGGEDTDGRLQSLAPVNVDVCLTDKKSQRPLAETE